MNDDYLNNIDVDPKDLLVTGQVEVGDSATGVIDFEKDNDWFKVELKGRHTYVIDLEGSFTEMGTLSDPVIRGIFDSLGQRINWTFNDDVDLSGGNLNSRLTFTPEYSGTFYIAASSYGFPYGDMPTPYELGSYTISVVDTTPEAREVLAPVDDVVVSRPSSGSSNSGSSGSSSSGSSSSGSSNSSEPVINSIASYINNHPNNVGPPGSPSIDYNFVTGTDNKDMLNAADYINDPEYDYDPSLDFYIGGKGEDDVITGGAGDDILLGDGFTYDTTPRSIDGDDILNGGPGNDELYGFDGDDTLNGGPGNDILFGDKGIDTLNGGSGNDLLVGGEPGRVARLDDNGDPVLRSNGNPVYDYFGDTLNGGPGNDILSGESGDDIFRPGSGRDFMIGGSGNDTYIFGSNDGHNTIFDFGSRSSYSGHITRSNSDQIDISGTGLEFDDLHIEYLYATDTDGFYSPTGDIVITFAGTTILLDSPFLLELTEGHFIV